MKLRMTFALAVATLTIGVPAAAADPDGYQPQLKSVAQLPDALDRYLANNKPEVLPDALDRYLWNNGQAETAGAATHPDSRAVRPMPTSNVSSAGGEARDWTTGVVGALGGAIFAIFAIAGASAIRERRRVVLR